MKELLSPLELNNKESILSILTLIYQSNEKANKLADLAIHGNQALKQSGANSIYDFIRQYIDTGLVSSSLKYELEPENEPFCCKFDSTCVGIILDNIISNSIKAGATTLHIQLSESNKYVEIAFSDNGIGLAENVDPASLFEWGYSSNRVKKGFGIGLYHIKQLIEEMKGTVEIDASYQAGFRLIVRLRK